MNKQWAAVAASLIFGACVHAPEAANTRLYVLDCGRMSISDLAAFSDEGVYDGVQRDVITPCYLVRHAEGDLLWDTGLPDVLNEQPNGVVNGPFHITVPTTLASQLTALGLAAADIDYVAISHSHFDHSGNAGMFANSTWLSNPAEYAFMFRDEVREAETFAAYAALEDIQTIDVTENYDVFGDGVVTLIQTPGHTPGHMSLLLRLENAGPLLLTGDLYHLPQSRAERRVPTFNVDREQTLASMEAFEALAQQTGARVVIQHDLDTYEEMRAAGDYID